MTKYLRKIAFLNEKVSAKNNNMVIDGFDKAEIKIEINRKLSKFNFR